MEDHIINLTTEQISLVTILLSEFPYSNIKSKSITKELKEFTNTNPQLLVFNEISKQYYFSDIKNVLCIRASLYKDSEERVECFNFDQI